MRPLPENLISKEDALARLFSKWTPQPETERVALAEAAGRVLARDVVAAYDLPPVRASAMDGVAVKSALFSEGRPDTRLWRPGTDYVRADTGDDFDDAFDAVIMIEQVRLLEDGGLELAEDVEVRPGGNVKPGGCEVRRGTVVLRAGTRMTATDLAAAGMCGTAELEVLRKPRVAFLPTGSELVPPGSPLARGQNFDTNSVMAGVMLREMGAEPLLQPITPDDRDALRAAVEKLLPQCDILLLNAGTSKGDEDFCAGLLAEQGEVLFHGVAAVPGRPMSMAILDGKPVINLSGPAFAAFYSLDWAVRALVCRWLGQPLPVRTRVKAVLSEPLRTPPPLSAMTPMRLHRSPDGTLLASPLSNRGPNAAGSAAILTADAVYVSRPGEAPHAAGTEIELELLRGENEIV